MHFMTIGISQIAGRKVEKMAVEFEKMLKVLKKLGIGGMPPYRPYERPPGGGVREVTKQKPLELKHKKD